MLESMRKTPFAVALVVMLLVVLIELGSMAVLHVSPPSGSPLDISPNGKAIPAMAFLDGLLFYATLIMGIAVIFAARVQSKVQGIITLLFSLLLILGAIAVLFTDFALLTLMVGLLLSVPFGTIAYFAIWADFDTGNARIVLSLLLTLKIAFAICLFLAHQGFLKMKGYVLVIVTSMLSNLIIAFLNALVPGFLVSITDDVGAMIVCVLAIVWGVVYLIGGVVSIIKVII